LRVMLQNCLRSLLTHRPCDEAGAMAFSEVVVRRGMGLSVFAQLCLHRVLMNQMTCVGSFTLVASEIAIASEN
jgi:hypothetical protein